MAAPAWLHEADLAAQKYTEAVAAAAEACEDDTKGQTCYICTQALHWKTKEGLVRMCACRGTAGIAHVSCLAEQAKILVAEAVENNLDNKAKEARWARWYACSLCEQEHHGVVRCALGWACWKTYVGRPETDVVRCDAMGMLGNGLLLADRHADALAVLKAELSMARRLGADEGNLLISQGNLATTYARLGRLGEALRVWKDVYSGRLNLDGEEHGRTLIAANNYAALLVKLNRFEEAKVLLRKVLPVVRRNKGDSSMNTLKMRWNYADALFNDDGATLDDLREAVATLEETARSARRVLGGSHPITEGIEADLERSRAALRAASSRTRGAAIIYAAAALAAAAYLARRKLT